MAPNYTEAASTQKPGVSPGVQTPDLINGLFETGGAVAAWRNFLQLRRDKAIRGVYWPVYVFYSLWGVWNLVYYPMLSQWLSFTAGAVLVSGNIAWVVMGLRIIYGSKKE